MNGGNRLQKPLTIAAALLILGAIYYTVTAPPAAGFQSPELARILFFHLPCALVSAVMVFVGSFWAWKQLSKPSVKAESRLVASWELTTLLAVLTLVTGMLFSKVQWGAWWNWDPRQTSYLFVTLLLLGGIALRSGVQDEQKRGNALAGYALLMLVPIAFLTFVYPRLPQAISLHPSQTIAQGGLDSTYRVGVYLGFFGVLALTTLLWRQRVTLAELELNWETSDADLDDDRGGSADSSTRQPGVVPRQP